MSGLPPTLIEFYRHGPGPEVWEPLARRAADLDTATNRILLPAHGANTDDIVSLSPGYDGDGEGDLPSPLSKFEVYRVRVVSPRHFELAATPGDAPIDLTTAGTVGLTVHFDVGPSIEQALANQTSRFLACAAENGWEEPVGGWQGDVKDLIMDLAAWPQLDRRGYRGSREGNEKLDGYYIRWRRAEERLDQYCAGSMVPDGVVPAEPPVAGDAGGFGSSSWAEDPRGYLGQTATEPRRRAVAC